MGMMYMHMVVESMWRTVRITGLVRHRKYFQESCLMVSMSTHPLIFNIGSLEARFSRTPGEVDIPWPTTSTETQCSKYRGSSPENEYFIFGSVLGAESNGKCPRCI